MGMNIYQKTKLIMLESNRCITLYNKLAKILVESNDDTLNGFVKQIRELVGKGRITNDLNKTIFGKVRNEIITYCDLQTEDKFDIKTALKTLSENYKSKLNNSINYSKDIGYEDIMSDIISDLENLLKKY